MAIFNVFMGVINFLIKGNHVHELIAVVMFGLIVGAYYLLYTQRALYKKVISVELVRQQMSKAEEFFIGATKMIISNYMHLKADLVEDKKNLMNDRDVHHFDFVLYRVMQEIKDRVRFFFRENHLAEMSETEFNTHIEQRAELITNEFTELLNMYYYYNSIPTRVELYDSQDRLKLTGNELIKDCFRQGRKLAIEFQSRKERKKYNV